MCLFDSSPSYNSKDSRRVVQNASTESGEWHEVAPEGFQTVSM